MFWSAERIFKKRGEGPLTRGASELSALRSWVEDNHEQKVINRKGFKALMEAKLFIYQRKEKGVFVEGVGLRVKN